MQTRARSPPKPDQLSASAAGVIDSQVVEAGAEATEEARKRAKTRNNPKTGKSTGGKSRAVKKAGRTEKGRKVKLSHPSPVSFFFFGGRKLYQRQHTCQIPV